ncbi:hypothetical protein Tco_1163536 [Tanacetum coccineum]
MDSMIPTGQKNTLVEYMILSGADNRPPMLDKDLYDSWKSIMELYMQNREHRRMILESVEHGPLIWHTIEENGVTMTKKYVKLSPTKKIQADCDMKAINIILQGLPTDIYSLVNHHKVAKDLWEKVQLLMQGTSLTKQERECKLYDAFDKFTHIKKESLHLYYLRFTQLINDMNIYNMKLEQFQVNTKFLNSLPPEWSKFVTDVKLVKDLHTTNFDFLYAYLEQHEFHANEVRRQNSYAAGTSGTRANTSRTCGNYLGQQRVVKCFNSQGEAQRNGKVLTEEELEFLADLGIAKGPVIQSVITHNVAYQVDDLDAYGTDCDEISTPKAVLMANLSSYESDVLSERMRYIVIVNAAVQDTNSFAQQDALILSFADLKKEINNLKQTLSEQSKEKELLTKTFNVFKNESKEKEAKNIDTEIALEKKVKELDNIVCKMGQSAQTVHMLTKPQVFYDNNLKQALGFQNPFYLKKAQQIRQMLYNGNVIAKETNVISIVDSEETLMLEEESRSKMLLKQTLHPIIDQSASSPIKIEAPRELPKITPNALTKGEWGFEHTKAVFQNEIIPFLKTLKDIFNVFDKDLLNEVTEVQTVFNQMEAAVQQYHVDKQCFEIQKKHFLFENDQLLDQIISQDIMNIVVNSLLDENTSVNVNSSVAMIESVNYVEICNKCLKLKAELIKQHNMVEKDEYNRISKRLSELEQHCISLEIAIQLNKEIFQKNNTSVNQTKPSFYQLKKVFVITTLKNDLSILKRKDTVGNVAQMSNATNMAPGMEVVEQAKSRNHLDSASYSACVYVKLIQELLSYVRDTCPNIHKPSEKLVTGTPINKKKIVRFADTAASSSNMPKVTNRPLLSSTGVKPSTSASGSKPSGNTKNDRISRTPSSNEKNKVEVLSRKVKSKLQKQNYDSKNFCNEHVKHPVKGAQALCSVCNECFFDVNHAMRLIDHVNSMNVRDKSAFKKIKKEKNRNLLEKCLTLLDINGNPPEGLSP